MKIKNEVINKKLEKSNKEIFKMKITRTLRGVEVFLKSEVLEEFFSLTSNNETMKPSSLPGLRAYKHQGGLPVSVKNCNLGSIEDGLISNSHFNASLFRLRGLREGVKVVFNIVISREKLQSIAQEAKEVAKELFLNYIKKFEIEITITEKEMF
jgi:hypothetical protein